MLKPVCITPPTQFPVTTAEARRQCNITHASDDALLDFLISAGTSHIDGYTGILGRCLMPQTWRVDCDAWPCDRLRLPLAPVASISSVKYRDSSDAEVIWSASNYRLLEDALSPYVYWSPSVSLPSLYDRPDALSVTFVAGYADAASIPPAIKHGLLLWISTMYGQREEIVVGTVVEKLPGGGSLLEQFCRGGLSA